MSSQTFMVVLALGAALLAMWVHARFPSLAPAELPRTMLHAVLAFALLKATPSLLDGPAPLVGTFLLVLPALVYALLGTIWLLRQAQAAFGMR
jgi:hypothetical protein